MARNAGGCVCSPTMAQNKREGGTVSATHTGFQIALDAVAKEAKRREKLALSSSVDGWRQQPIPKEHDHLIEMLFPPPPVRHHRSRNPFPLGPLLTTSGLFRSSKQLKSEPSKGSVRWFRDRTNSLLPPPKPDPDLDPVSAPDACCRSGELSVTLPTGRRRRGRSNSSREEEEEDWPEYILRLDRKTDRQCTCTGCKDACTACKDACTACKDACTGRKDACTRTYGRPMVYNVGAYFDNEFYYNAHDGVQRDGHWSSRRRREDEQTTRKNVACCTEAELYHVPSPPTSPPPTGGSTSLSRIYAPKNQFFNEGTRFTAYDPDRCSGSRSSGRPDRLEASSGGRLDGYSGRGDPVAWYSRESKPPEIDDWMRIRTSGSERNPDPWVAYGDGGYMESDAGVPVAESDEPAVSPSGTPDGHVSLYPDFNRVVPSGIYNRISFESGDYLTPYTANSTRFLLAGGKVEKEMDRDDYYSNRYLAMDSGNSRFSRDQNEAATDDTFKSLQKRGIIRSSKQIGFLHDRCQARMTKEEPGAHRLLTDSSLNINTDNSGEQQKMETKGELLEFEENVKTDCKNDKKQEFSIESDELVNSPSIDSQGSEERERKTVGPMEDEKQNAYSQTSKIEMEEPRNSVNTDDDLTVAEVVENSRPDFGEREANVRPKQHTAPPLALRSCSQLDLLLMSPPPQCSLMIEHPYFNITNNYSTDCNEVPVPVDHKYQCVSRRMKEVENKEMGRRRKDFCLLEDAVKEMSISQTEATPWQGATCNKKGPASPHVNLYKKFVNDYCHTYLPTPIDRLKCIECLADSS